MKCHFLAAAFKSQCGGEERETEGVQQEGLVSVVAIILCTSEVRHGLTLLHPMKQGKK